MQIVVAQGRPDRPERPKSAPFMQSLGSPQGKKGGKQDNASALPSLQTKAADRAEKEREYHRRPGCPVKPVRLAVLSEATMVQTMLLLLLCCQYFGVEGGNCIQNFLPLSEFKDLEPISWAGSAQGERAAAAVAPASTTCTSLCLCCCTPIPLCDIWCAVRVVVVLLPTLHM